MFKCDQCDSKVKKVYDAGHGWDVCGKCRAAVIKQGDKFTKHEQANKNSSVHNQELHQGNGSKSNS